VTVTADPEVILCAGGGGVGKTTTAAAIGLALARSGRRTLVVTIDPARRLAGALGVSLGDSVSRVEIPEAQGRLAALMPDPRRSLGTFVEQLFADEPAARARVAQNRLFTALSDAVAGIHELVAMNLVARAAEGGDFDVVVIDTAPSRQAVDFVTYPERLTMLLGGRSVAWLADLAARAAAPDAPPSRGSLRAWGASHVEALVAKVTGPSLVRDTADLFGDLALVRERFVGLTAHASRLLLGERAAYALVAAPTAAARDDVLFLAARLEALGRAPRAVILNRAEDAPTPHLQLLRDSPGATRAVQQAAAVLADESARRGEAARSVGAELARRVRVPQVRLPWVESVTPFGTVAALCDAVAPHLSALLPPPRRARG
jgi:anion-transporting  ArsA/GET3 family ATPase